MHDRHGRRSQRIRHVIGPLVSAPEIAQVQIAPGPQTGPHFLEADLSRHTVRLEILIQFSTSPARSGIRRQHAARGSEIPPKALPRPVEFPLFLVVLFVLVIIEPLVAKPKLASLPHPSLAQLLAKIIEAELRQAERASGLLVLAEHFRFAARDKSMMTAQRSELGQVSPGRFTNNPELGLSHHDTAFRKSSRVNS
jgi:hypothetical protein